MEVISGAGKHRKRLMLVLALTSTYMIAEVVGGLVTGSLALIADAGHMLTDVFGLALALFAIWFGSRSASPQRTYGYYRAEILASLANAMLLFFVSGYILYEALRRFQAPPEVQSGPMMLVALVGLGVNIAGAWILHGASKESLNMQGAFLEVISDMLGSIGVIIAGAIIYFIGWTYADPLFSVAIGLFIIPRTWKLLQSAVGILLEGTPSHLNLAELRAALEAVPGVEAVHDLHVWSITSGVDAMSGHVRVDGTTTSADVLQQLNEVLKERFKIGHTTIQVEEKAYEQLCDEAQQHA